MLKLSQAHTRERARETTIAHGDRSRVERILCQGVLTGQLWRYAIAAVFSFSISLTALSALAWGAEKSPGTRSQPVPEPSQNAGSPVQVQGFRSAHWGMTQKEVEAAIRRDFGIPPSKIHVETNSAERTTVLTVNIGNLLDDAGEARVSYILGYSTKKLIEINILWGTPVDPHVKRENILSAASQLRTLFLTAGYQRSSIISNVVSRSGATIVFEGRDAQKHMTVLRLVDSREPLPSDGHRHAKSSGLIVVLLLSYIENTTNPDIYRLKKGQF